MRFHMKGIVASIIALALTGCAAVNNPEIVCSAAGRARVEASITKVEKIEADIHMRNHLYGANALHKLGDGAASYQSDYDRAWREMSFRTGLYNDLCVVRK